MEKFIADKRLESKTIKQFFDEEGFSSSQIKRFKYDGEIRVNGEIVTVRYILKQGDVVEIRANSRLATPYFADKAANVLYRDEWLYVAEKPYGIATHPDRTHRLDTLGNMLAAYFKDGFELRVVTRLDKTTSGLVLGALDEVTAQKLNDMQLSHSIAKEYVAELEGILESDKGEITFPLARDDAQNKTVVCSDGKYARTVFTVEKRLASSTVTRLFPITGRTHQLRAHTAAYGHPVVGDVLYGAAPADRVRLHCERLTFVHPYTKKTVDVVLPHNFDI